jgi:xylan 1,4-beta-xylosidase
MRYKNPVIPGFYPDPSFCRVGDDYYLVTSSFEYFPGVPIFHSRNLVNWTQIGHCLTRKTQLKLHLERSTSGGLLDVYKNLPGFSGGIYAPTLRYHDGTFYMITTNLNLGKHLCVHTTDPAGEWSEPIWIDHGDIGWTIDPSLFFDDDGKVYLTCKGSGPPAGIYQFEIDIKTGERLTEPQFIWADTSGKDAEGPHLYRINGWYFLMVAEGGTEYGHLESLGRSDNPYGPFEMCPYNPILSHRSLSSPIQATGHADIEQDQNGNWWSVFLGVRPNGYPPAYHLGRETFLAPVNWTDDDWFVIGEIGKSPAEPNVKLEMEVAALPQAPDCQQMETIHDDFVLPELNLEWNFYRNLDAQYWSLDERSGWLTLKGSALTLDEMMNAPVFVGRRQQHFECVASTMIEFEPQEDGEEAGLTIFQNNLHHYEIAVVRRDGKRQVIVRRRIGTLSVVVAEEDIAEGLVTLEIRADRTQYEFAYGLGIEAVKVIATGETRYLSTEVGGGFVGVYFAMYATGNGKASSTPACFDWFKYAPIYAG